MTDVKTGRRATREARKDLPEVPDQGDEYFRRLTDEVARHMLEGCPNKDIALILVVFEAHGFIASYLGDTHNVNAVKIFRPDIYMMPNKEAYAYVEDFVMKFADGHFAVAFGTYGIYIDTYEGNTVYLEKLKTTIRNFREAVSLKYKFK